MKIDLKQVEEAAKQLYIRACKLLPPDIKTGFARLDKGETDATAKSVLGTMIKNITVAEANDNLLCQDTGIPIYNVTIGRGVDVDGYALKQAIATGCARATKEHPLRSSVVHPVTRKNEHTSCGRLVPVINIDFIPDASAARRTSACTCPRLPPRARWAPRVKTRKVQNWRPNSPRRSTCWASARRVSAAIRRPSPCT